MPTLKTLSLEQGEYETQLSTKFERRKNWVAPNPDRLQSFLPGVIQTIFVSPGTRVTRGERLLAFEAMKMENSLLAPRDGVVGAVHVKVGDMVPKGTVLVDMTNE